MADTIGFSGDTEADLNLVRELLDGIPPSARLRAKSAAVQIEKVYTGIAKNHPKDPAVGLGLAFAILYIAHELTSGVPQPGQKKGLIELLS